MKTSLLSASLACLLAQTLTATPAMAAAAAANTASALQVASLAPAKTAAATHLNLPDLDLTIQYYNKVTTPDGVLREARYEEKMLRRADHVWVARVLPKTAAPQEHAADAAAKPGHSSADAKKPAQTEHAQFNYVVLPRHVLLENGKVRIEFINPEHKEVVSVPPAEYENVAFDGSWDNANFLLDPKLMKALPLSSRASPVPGARWRENEQNGVFQRVLWNEQKQIPLMIETGDKVASWYRRVEIKLETNLSKNLPWQNLKGFAQKEYSDFLD